MCRFRLLLWGLAVAVLASSAHAEDQVAAAIANLAKDRPKAERLAAAKWLRQSKDVGALRAIGALSAACKDDDVDIRYESVLALGLLCSRHDRPSPLVLVEAMLDPSSRVRETVLVGKKLPREAIPLLLKCAAHMDGKIRADAMVPMAWAGAKNSVVLAVLHQAAHDRELFVRNNAVVGIWYATNDLSQVVPHLLLFTADSENPADDDAEGFRATARKIITISAAKRLYEHGMKRPKDMCDVLVKLVDSDIPAIRRTATRNLRAMAISSAKSKRVLEAQGVPDLLRKLLDDPDVKVAAMAALGLKEFEK